jgi:CRP-like cAMP-binding protein
MNPKKALRELEKQLRRQPGSLVIRIRLAAALHAVGRLPEAVDLYRSVAMAYFAQGRLDQAMAVCHSLLEIAPMHQDTHLLLAELDSHKTRRGQVPDNGGDPFAPPAGWAAPFDGDPLTPGSEPGYGQGVPRREAIRRDTGMLQRETGPMSWRESGRFARRETPDPGSVPGSGGGSGSGSGSGSIREGSVASRLPLPVVRTFTGIAPGPAGSRARGTSETTGAPPTAPGKLRRELPLGGGSRATRPPPHERPTLPPNARDADDDAPTHIADRWNPLAVDPLRATMAAPAGMRPAARRGSTGQETFTAPRAPAGSDRVPVPAPRPRPRRPPGDGVADHAEPTQYDDGMELARALGKSFGTAEEAPLDSNGRLPLLSGLSERSVEAIAAGMVRRRVSSGELIVRDGEPGDSCFVLARGEARVLKRDPLLPRGDLVEVSRLGDGDLFGEVAMLGDRRRHASVQAVSDCDLLEIPRGHLIQVGRRFPDVESFMQQFYRERLIATLVSTASFFRPLDQAQRTSLLSHFRFSHVEPGTRIIGEGERAGGFFLIVLGSVEITRRVSERRQVLLATLGEGTYFGEMSLLRGEVARASVTTTAASELAVLPAKNFYALVANHPVLWDQVRQEAHQRELEMVQIVTGVTGTV